MSRRMAVVSSMMLYKTGGKIAGLCVVLTFESLLL